MMRGRCEAASRAALGAAALVAAVQAGCGDRLEALEGPGAGASIPPEVQAAFDRTCNAGCHEAATQAGGLSLATGASEAIVEGASSQSELPLVTLGDVEGSYLAVKMLPDAVLPEGVTRSGSRMPPAPTQEDRLDVALILGWIAGADLPEGEAP